LLPLKAISNTHLLYSKYALELKSEDLVKYEFHSHFVAKQEKKHLKFTAIR